MLVDGLNFIRNIQTAEETTLPEDIEEGDYVLLMAYKKQNPLFK